MTPEERFAQSIIKTSESRAQFNDLWHSKIRPRIAELSSMAEIKFLSREKSTAEIAMDIAYEAAWVAWREGK